jgi:hypothetical protein
MTGRVLVFILVALSLVNAYSFVKLYSSTYVSSDVALINAPTARLPASIPSAPVAPPNDLQAHLSLDLNCGDHGKLAFKASRKVNGQWAQLRGRVCGSDKLKTVEIMNLNNGFTASVFSLGLQQYQTDLIQLDDGINKIRVKIIPIKGAIVEQTVTIDSHHI